MVIIFSQQFIKIGMTKNKNPKNPTALKKEYGMQICLLQNKSAYSVLQQHVLQRELKPWN